MGDGERQRGRGGEGEKDGGRGASEKRNMLFPIWVLRFFASLRMTEAVTLV